MNRILCGLVLCATAMAAGAEPLTMEQAKTMPTKQVEANLADSHPSAVMAYSMRLFKSNKQDQAVIWYYVGQLRYKYLLLVNPDAGAEAAQLQQVTSSYGPAINDWAGQQVRHWGGSINTALEWDASKPNATTPKEEHPAELKQARDEMATLRDKILASEAAIRAERAAKGLQNR